MIIYQATLTIRTEAGLDDARLTEIVEDTDQIVDGPLGEQLVEAIIQVLDDQDTLDVTFS